MHRQRAEAFWLCAAIQGRYLCDATLHDEEVRIVHVQLHGMEQIMDRVLLHHVGVDLVLVLAPDNDLARHINLFRLVPV